MKRLLRKARSLKAGLREVANKEIGLIHAKKLDIEDIRTVCIALGPYRNLTTLTAAIIALHPHCQVLNHAGQRIFKDKRLNFFLDYNDEKFETFVRFAIYASKGGREGPYGGRITLSHAFDAQYKVKRIYERAYGETVVKNRIYCLFWKESMATSNHIRDHSVDLHNILSRNHKLRFIMPIRNPLDCAVSNLKFFGKTQLCQLFTQLNGRAGVGEVIEAILDEFLWFLELKKQHPDRLFYYFEHEFGNKIVRDMGDFLSIDADEQWCKNSLEAFDVKSRYKHPEDIVDIYKKAIEDKLSIYPSFCKKLLQFTEGYQ